MFDYLRAYRAVQGKRTPSVAKKGRKMKTERVVVLFLAILLLVVAGGLVWLSHSSMMPPTQKVEQAIPDDRIPR